MANIPNIEIKHCANNSRDQPTTFFLSFPSVKKDKERHVAWLQALDIKRIKDVKGRHVCENHFTVSGYLPNF